MAVLAAGAGRLYGSKDESNGRVNPALEPDYDMEPGYSAVQSEQGMPTGGGGGFFTQAGSQPSPPSAFNHTIQVHSSTAF